MPIYTFDCLTKLGGCGHQFETFLYMSDIPHKYPNICPQCKKINTITRNFAEDLPTNQVVKGDTEIKVGHLAKRNTERFSEDEKEAIYRKNNAYKFTAPDRDLPNGMQYIGEPGKREPSLKQHKKDPKRKRKTNERKKTN